MISVAEIEAAIKEAESRETSYSNCARLADLYICRDHLITHSAPKPPNEGEKGKDGSRSAFIIKAEKTSPVTLWEVLDEVFSVIEVTNPGLYNAAMSRLG